MKSKEIFLKEEYLSIVQSELGQRAIAMHAMLYFYESARGYYSQMDYASPDKCSGGTFDQIKYNFVEDYEYSKECKNEDMLHLTPSSFIRHLTFEQRPSEFAYPTFDVWYLAIDKGADGFEYEIDPYTYREDAECAFELLVDELQSPGNKKILINCFEDGRGTSFKINKSPPNTEVVAHYTELFNGSRLEEAGVAFRDFLLFVLAELHRYFFNQLKDFPSYSLESMADCFYLFAQKMKSKDMAERFSVYVCVPAFDTIEIDYPYAVISLADFEDSEESSFDFNSYDSVEAAMRGFIEDYETNGLGVSNCVIFEANDIVNPIRKVVVSDSMSYEKTSLEIETCCGRQFKEKLVLDTTRRFENIFHLSSTAWAFSYNRLKKRDKISCAVRSFGVDQEDDFLPRPDLKFDFLLLDDALGSGVTVREFIKTAFEQSISSPGKKDSIDKRISNGTNFCINSHSTDDPVFKMLGFSAALEALVGKKGEGLVNAISTRIAVLLEHDPSKRSVAKKQIKKIYNERSLIIHGEKIEVDEKILFYIEKLAVSLLAIFIERASLLNKGGFGGESPMDFFDEIEDNVWSNGSLFGISPTRAREIWETDNV